MKKALTVLFVSSGNSPYFKISPIIFSQGESLKQRGINVKYYITKGKGILGYLHNIVLLNKYLKNNTIDIIHAHYALNGWIISLVFTKTPKVLSFMGSDLHGSRNYNIILNYFLIVQSFLIQLFIKNIIVKSKKDIKNLWRRRNVRNIPNGINFDKFKPLDKKDCREKLGLPLDKKIILFLGSINDENKNFRLVVDSITKIQDNDIILLTPFPVPHNRIPLYLNSSDVLAFSSYMEGSPNVIKEALACNVNIVTTISGNILEMIRGIDNVFISEFSVDDFAKNIKKALRNNKRNSRDKIKVKLDENKVAEKLINFYNEIIKV